MLIRLKSNNPEFSFAIGKNPISPPVVKELCKGIGIAFFDVNDPQHHLLYFKDSPTEVSYGPGAGAFEFTDTARYNNPCVVNDLMKKFYNYTQKEVSAFDKPGYIHELEISLLDVPRQIKRALENYLNDSSVQFEFGEDVGNSCRVKIISTNNLNEVICAATLLSAFCYKQEQNFEDEYIIKMAKLAAGLKLPYFLRYILKGRLIRTRHQFKLIKEYLELPGEEMNFGNNQQQRYFAAEHLVQSFAQDFHDPILVDIGCGEGDYVYLAKKAEKYIGVDRDPDALIEAGWKVKKKNLENVELIDSIDLVTVEPDIIICTEVIEHNEVSEVEPLLDKLVSFKAKKLWITVPNREFNKYYLLGEGEMRHDDHKWEPTFEEFKNLFKKYESEFTITFKAVGDGVDGIYSNVGALLEPK